MSGARFSEGYLSPGHAMALLGIVAEAPTQISTDALAKHMSAVFHAPAIRTRNTISLLSELEILTCQDNSTTISASLPRQAEILRQLIAEKVATELVRRIEEHQAWACVRHIDEREISLNGMMLPGVADGLGIWILGFGIASRASKSSYEWRIEPLLYPLFLDALHRLNGERIRRPKTADQLALELAMQSELGEQAEQWVVEYEKVRLTGHPLRDQVRRISSEDVSAGYDIVSFSSISALRHDLFIEVKSHGARRAFHWSRNEIARAKELGERYALYVIDRTRLDDPEYQPHVIYAPTHALFENSDMWSVEATSFELVALEN